MHGAAGTYAYLAPEIFQNAPYNSSVDTWALGVSVYLLLVGCLPFELSNKSESFANRMKAAYSWPEYCGLSIFARDFVRKLLVVEPGARMTADECLQHPWVRFVVVFVLQFCLIFDVFVTDCEGRRSRGQYAHGSSSRQFEEVCSCRHDHSVVSKVLPAVWIYPSCCCSWSWSWSCCSHVSSLQLSECAN